MVATLRADTFHTEELKQEMTPAVHFPCTRGLAFGGLVVVEGFIAGELRGKVKVITRGIDEEAITRVIEASRYKEEGEIAEQGILVSFSNNMFLARDAGLALAIYDKVLRFTYECSYAEIYAAGHVDFADKGMISPVKNFGLHCSMVRDLGKQQSLFLYPQANSTPADNLTHELDALEGLGISCRGINHIDELPDLLSEPGRKR